MECLTGKLPAMTCVDKGYKGHGVPEELSHAPIRGTHKLGYAFKRPLRWKAAIEPEIDLMKGEVIFGRNFLRGMVSDAMNAILPSVGHNMGKILARLRALLRLLPAGARAILATILVWLEAVAFLQPALTPA